MASSVDRYRPPRGDAYVPPTLPVKPAAPADRRSKSRSPSRRREIPPAVPTPPTASSRNSPPRPHSHRGPPSPSQPSSSRNPYADQWIFTADELLSTPSILDGMPPAEERMKRAKGVNFIYQVGITVQPQPLPQLTLYVAGVFFHRFYMRWSMVESKGGYHPYNIAATSLFLANKTEENCYKTKSLIIAIAKVAQKNPELVIDELSEEYWRWRDTILQCEEIMLEILTFDLNIINPYQQLWHHLDKLGLLHDKAIRNQAWAFLNDAGLTTLPVLFDASEIAVLSIFFASESKDIKIKDQDGVPWWKVLEGDEHRIAAGMEVVEQFFMNNPLGKRDPRQPRSPGFTLDSTRRRGGEGFLSQHEVDSSRGGTPMDVDGRGTQSQDSRANGRVKEEHDSQHDSMGLPNMRGDSDAALKAAANDLDSHPINTTNGDGLRSPSFKRKNEDEPMAESGQESKRRRLSDHDEGEIEA